MGSAIDTRTGSRVDGRHSQPLRGSFEALRPDGYLCAARDRLPCWHHWSTPVTGPILERRGHHAHPITRIGESLHKVKGAANRFPDRRAIGHLPTRRRAVRGWWMPCAVPPDRPTAWRNGGMAEWRDRYRAPPLPLLRGGIKAPASQPSARTPRDPGAALLPYRVGLGASGVSRARRFPGTSGRSARVHPRTGCAPATPSRRGGTRPAACAACRRAWNRRRRCGRETP